MTCLCLRAAKLVASDAGDRVTGLAGLNLGHCASNIQQRCQGDVRVYIDTVTFYLIPHTSFHLSLYLSLVSTILLSPFYLSPGDYIH